MGKKARISYKTPRPPQARPNKYTSEEREKFFLDYMSLGADRRGPRALHKFIKQRALETNERVPGEDWLQRLSVAEKWEERAKAIESAVGVDGAFGAWVSRFNILPTKINVPEVRNQIRAKLYALTDGILNNVAYRQGQELRGREEAIRDFTDLRSATIAIELADRMEAGILTPDNSASGPSADDVAIQVDSLIHDIERRAYDSIMKQQALKEFAGTVLDNNLIDVTEAPTNA